MNLHENFETDPFGAFEGAVHETESGDLPTPRAPMDSPLQQRCREVDTLRRDRALARRTEDVHRLDTRAGDVVHGRVIGPNRIDSIRELHSATANKIRDDLLRGVVVHRRLPRLVRALPLCVLALDLAVLYTFCADLFNVPGFELSRNGLAAIGLAVLGSAVAYAWLAMTGMRLRDVRSELGDIQWRATGSATRVQLAVGMVLIAALAALMYQRVLEQALLAGAEYVSADQVLVLACVFAVLSAGANLTVIAVHALDGSHDVVVLDDTGRRLAKHQRTLRRQRHRMLRRVRRAGLGSDLVAGLNDGTPERDAAPRTGRERKNG